MDIAIKRFLFRRFEMLRKEPVIKCLFELEKNQTRNLDEISQLQKNKLYKLLLHSIRHVPFYQKRLGNSIALKSPDYAVNALGDIPILKKEDLRAHREEMISSDGIKVYSAKSSGSTGRPLKFYKDRITSAYTYAAMYRGLRWFGINYCDREAYLWGIPLGRIDNISAKLRDFILNRFREKAFSLSDKVNYQFYKKIVSKKPPLLSGYGTLIYEFARYVHKQKLDFQRPIMRVIKYTAEMMYDYQRDFASKVFRCPVVSEYGSAETGIVSFQCPQGGHHVMSDCVLVEFKKDNYTGLFRVIVTNLNSYGFPIIRYDTGDLVKTECFSNCSCGLPFPIMNEIIGRSSDIVQTPEGKRVHSNIFSYIIKELMKIYANIDQIRFIQRNVNEIIVEVVAKKEINGLKDDIVHLVQERLSPKMQVNFKRTSSLKRSDSRKLRYFVSETGDE